HYQLQFTRPKEHLELLQQKHKDSVLSAQDIHFIFVFSSETLISKRLSVNTRPEIQQPVREFMRLHLKEEAEHRKYFIEKFKSIFLRWSKEKQHTALSVIGECVKTFLAP